MKKNKIILISGAAMILIIALITLSVFSRKREKPFSRTEFMLDTICTISLYGYHGDADSVLDGAFELCGQYERMLSTTVTSSDIYRINHSGGQRVDISPETAGLISRALEYCRLSGGAFDITIYPVKQMWNFRGGSDFIPDEAALLEAASRVDYTRVSLDRNSITLPDGMGIDLGAIAKGFAADRLATYLRSCGVKSAVIDLGGNVYVIGSKPDGSKWRVGIQEPFETGQADVIEISDCSAVTSGVYQRYFESDGRIYHHILDAKTGMPCDNSLYSVTVVSQSSELCDALSTVCMLVGYEKASELLREFPDVESIFITSDRQILYVNR